MSSEYRFGTNTMKAHPINLSLFEKQERYKHAHFKLRLTWRYCHNGTDYKQRLKNKTIYLLFKIEHRLQIYIENYLEQKMKITIAKYITGATWETS